MKFILASSLIAQTSMALTKTEARKPSADQRIASTCGDKNMTDMAVSFAQNRTPLEANHSFDTSFRREIIKTLRQRSLSDNCDL